MTSYMQKRLEIVLSIVKYLPDLKYLESTSLWKNTPKFPNQFLQKIRDYLSYNFNPSKCQNEEFVLNYHKFQETYLRQLFKIQQNLIMNKFEQQNLILRSQIIMCQQEIKKSYNNSQQNNNQQEVLKLKSGKQFLLNQLQHQKQVCLQQLFYQKEQYKQLYQHQQQYQQQPYQQQQQQLYQQQLQQQQFLYQQQQQPYQQQLYQQQLQQQQFLYQQQQPYQQQQLQKQQQEQQQKQKRKFQQQQQQQQKFKQKQQKKRKQQQYYQKVQQQELKRQILKQQPRQQKLQQIYYQKKGGGNLKGSESSQGHKKYKQKQKIHNYKEKVEEKGSIQSKKQLIKQDDKKKQIINKIKEQQKQKQNVLSQKNNQSIENKSSLKQIQKHPNKFSIEEIRKLINNYSQNKKQGISNQLIKKIEQVKEWKQRTEKVHAKPQPNQKNNKINNHNTSSRYKPNQEANAIRMGINFQKDHQDQFVLILGKNQTLEAQKMKQQIKDQAKIGARTLMESEQQNLNDQMKVKRQIVFNLNLLAPENLESIQKDLEQYLYTNRKNCQVMVAEIIEKAWQQPKYASTYAKLCRGFTKKHVSLFKFLQKDESSNPFKQFLIEKVQRSFEKDGKKITKTSQLEQEEQLKEIKKQIFGNIQFIAELIIIKVLNKKIIKYCISQMLATFLKNFYYNQKTSALSYSYYDYYFEAIIRFVQCIGEKYQTIDDDKKKNSSYKQIEKFVIKIAQLEIQPPNTFHEQFNNLTTNQYFKIFALIDNKIIKKIHPRLSALLKNLEQRRDNKWQKHLAQAQRPQKLGQSQELQEKMTIQQSNKRNKSQLQFLDKKVKDVLQGFTQGYKEEVKDIKTILKQFSQEQFFLSYFKQVADEKKELIYKRFQLFQSIYTNFFNISAFKRAWKSAIEKLAYSSSDFPYCGACLAKILQVLSEKRGVRLEDFYVQSEDQDQQFFMEEVFQKLYHYTQILEIKNFVEIKQKLTRLL